MNYFTQLSEDEARYICSVIPLEESVSYFKRYPKEFAKIMPGFRAKSMRSQEQVGALFFRCRNHPFVSSFIEKHISRWLEEIQEHITRKIDEGANRESALIQTLPFCFFSDNISVYFKLVNEEFSEEYIMLLSAAIKTIKETEIVREKLESELKEIDSEKKRQLAEIEHIKSVLDATEKKINESTTEIKVLRSSSSELGKLKNIVKTEEEVISKLKNKVIERDESIQILKAELSKQKDECESLENKIQVGFEKQQASIIIKEKRAKNPLYPKDIDEFKDYLGYNFENIGISTDSEYFYLLKEHLSHILFQGIPILINIKTSRALMECVANAIIGTVNIRTLVFTHDISEQTIDYFLSEDGYIVCLDNFVGNYNETVILTLCEKYKDKIIFLTVAYDRTVCFLPNEFMKYCHYLNLNRIEALTINDGLTEDPSTIEMVVASSKKGVSDMRYSNLLRDILKEFEFPKNLVEYKCALIANEQELCGLLAFDIIPYCVDVLKTLPFNDSERLIMYAGDTGRCPYKGLFRRWFG